MSTQLTLSKSFDCQLSALEKRVDEKRAYHGLKLWTPIFRGILELMQLEHEVKSGAMDKALARLEHIKSLVACVCLGVLSLTSVDFDNDQFVRSRGVRRSREELLLS